MAWVDRNRLFIDKVLLCEGFEKAINSIHARGGWDIYLTGSNAFLLSSDLATLFTGRHGEVHILPFSEYRSYFDEQGAVDDDFDGFIRRGGLAGSYDYDGISESYGFLRRARIGTRCRSRGTRSESGTPRCAPVSWRSRR